MDWGRAIRTLRAHHDFTQERLARLADLSSSYVSLIESGERKPSLDVIERVAEALGTPVWFVAFLASDDEEQQRRALARIGEMKAPRAPVTYVVHHRDHPPCLFLDHERARAAEAERGPDYTVSMYMDQGGEI